MPAKIARGCDRRRNERHEVRRKVGTDREHAARYVRAGAVNRWPLRPRRQGGQRGVGDQLIAPTARHGRVEAGGETRMRELNGRCGTRGEQRIVAENHHGRRVRSADICEWWQRRHA